MLKYTGLHLPEFETGEGVKCEPMPVFPVYPEITNEKTFCGACQVENSHYIIDLGNNSWTDRTWRAKVSVTQSHLPAISCLPPDAQMNFEDLNLAKTLGVSPSSLTSDGTMLQMLIPAWSARDSISPTLGRTPGGPKMHCRLKSEGIRMSIIIPAP
jgi:hypothetical protein